MIDQNIPGFGDDNLGNDGDGDSLTKSKLNLNTSKDKKKTFFKKVRSILFSDHNRINRLFLGFEYYSLRCCT